MEFNISHQMSKMSGKPTQTPAQILPPGLSGHTYGRLFVRIGKVHYLQYENKDYVQQLDLSLLKFMLKFWGTDFENELRYILF